MTAAGTIRRLDEVRLADADAVGRKAGALGDLISAGMRVPSGFVLTLATLDTVLGDLVGTTEHERALSRIDEADLPRELEGELDAAFAPYRDVPVAVRSSGAAEDTDDASFAGQYETVLDVRGRDALLSAIRTCWRSALSARVSAYRGTPGEVRPEMAVLVQRMVPADAAGVAFSANPVTGNRSEVVVNATTGLGDQLVDGSVTPEQWTVTADGPVRADGPEKAISPEEAAEVARLATTVAATAGGPQDIEWAIADGVLYLLQARPITALPPEPEHVDPDDFWVRDAYHSRPQRRLVTSLVRDRLNEYSRHIFAYSLLDHFEYAERDGWTYSRIVYLREPAAIDAGIDAVVDAVTQDRPWSQVRRWHDTEQARLHDRVDRLTGTDLSRLTDHELCEHLIEARDLADRALLAHFVVGGAAAHLWGELGLACEELLGWTPADVLGLVTGLPSKTTEPTWELSRLAAVAAGHPDTVALLADVGPHTRDALTATDPEVAAGFERYLRTYGMRTLGTDLTEPTLAEQPELLLGLIRDQIASGYDPSATVESLRTAREAARTALLAAADGPAARDRLDALVERAQSAYPVRDDSAYYTNVTRAVVRMVALEIGARLHRGGRLPDVDAVFDLTLDDAHAAVLDGADRTQEVLDERARRERAAAVPGPPVLGRPGPPPSWAVSQEWIEELLPAAAGIMRVVMWVGRATTPFADTVGDAPLHGVAASRGRYTGPVRVITGESEFGKLRSGDVLVCPETTAQWSMLFPSVGALVTNTGGLLSHPAIIAREYGIPAVVATRSATTTLVDDQMVVVDGDTGDVWLLDEQA